MEIDTIAGEIADGCYALRSRRLARAITRTYDDRLRPHGLTAGQLSVLTVVELGADRPVEIGRRLDMEKSTVSRALQLMADRGWINIEPRSGGKRVTLTASGKDLVIAAAGAWRAATEEVAARLDRDGLLPVLDPEPAGRPQTKESP